MKAKLLKQTKLLKTSSFPFIEESKEIFSLLKKRFLKTFL